MKLTDTIIFARAGLTHATAVDARPSDALTLAALTGCPIYLAAVKAGFRAPAIGDGQTECRRP